MSRQIVSPEEAKAPEPTEAESPKPAGKIFRISNVTMLHFQDGTDFAFNKPELVIEDPEIVAKLEAYAAQPRSTVTAVT